MIPEINRRTFMKHSIVTPAAAALSLQAAAQDAGSSPPAPAPADALPQGKIGNLQISRMLLGGNLLTHYTHSRDLQYVYSLTAHYNTEEKILETLALAEQHGVNALVIHTVPSAIDTLKKHRYQKGGKMQWIICPTPDIEKEWEDYKTKVRELVDNGVEALYVWGVQADSLVGKGKLDCVKKAVELFKEHNVPAGVGAHDLKVVQECEANQVGADFYIKTFHHHNYPSGPKPEQLTGAYNETPAYWCRNPQETIDVMQGVEKPWLAFKIMAAGAIPPKDAFSYAFTNGADHILAGMFDFEIAEDVKIAKEALANVTRTRPWRS